MWKCGVPTIESLFNKQYEKNLHLFGTSSYHHSDACQMDRSTDGAVVLFECTSGCNLRWDVCIHWNLKSYIVLWSSPCYQKFQFSFQNTGSSQDKWHPHIIFYTLMSANFLSECRVLRLCRAESEFRAEYLHVLNSLHQLVDNFLVYVQTGCVVYFCSE